MTPLQKRELLKSVFPNATWKAKVDFMNNQQIMAILMSLRRQGKVSFR